MKPRFVIKVAGSNLLYSVRPKKRKTVPIPGYEGLYTIDNFGRVKNKRTGKIHKGYVIKKGYRYVWLAKGDERKYCRVCRLVAMAFLPNPENYPVVNHKDECKTNDTVYINDDGTVNEMLSNLEWCTDSYNTRYGSTLDNRLKSRFGKGYKRPTTEEERKERKNENSKRWYLNNLEKERERARQYKRRKKEEATLKNP